MTPGKVGLEWDAEGRMTFRTTLDLTKADTKKMMLQVLLDAAKSVNEMGTSLILPNGAPTRVMGGQG